MHYLRKMEFRSEEEYQVWDKCVKKIKQQAALMSRHREQHNLPDDVADPFVNGFMEQCRKLADKFGLDKVPRDIRRVVNDVESSLGMSVTIYPEITDGSEDEFPEEQLEEKIRQLGNIHNLSYFMV